MNIRKAKKSFKKRNHIKGCVKTKLYRNLIGDVTAVCFEGKISVVKQNGNKYEYNNSFDEVAQLVIEREKLFKGFHQQIIEVLMKSKSSQLIKIPS